MNTKDYFENIKASFSDRSKVRDITEQTYGNASVRIINDKSDEEVTIELELGDDVTELTPEEAYWLGKCLIDFAENAINIEKKYNQDADDE